ncbi:MAG: 3'-5' exonuclease [Paraclostridium sp.]
MNLKDRYYVLIDTETTGFNKNKHQLLEVGLVVLKNKQVVEWFEVKIKHIDYTINTEAMKANKIDLLAHEEEAYDEKGAAELILYILSKYIEDEKGLIVVGQNIDFDIGFLESMFIRVGKIKEYRKCISYRKLDIMQIALTKCLEGKIELERLDLDSLLNKFEIDILDNRHRALTDCYLELAVMNRLLDL